MLSDFVEFFSDSELGSSPERRRKAAAETKHISAAIQVAKGSWIFAFFAVGDDGRTVGAKAMGMITASAETYRLSHVLGQPLGGDVTLKDNILSD